MQNNKINVVTNLNFESKRVKKELIQKLNDAGYEVPEYFDDDAILTFSVGGDGSFLKAIQKNHFPSMPFVGINTGHLGFFNEILPSRIDEYLEKLKNKEYIIEETPLVYGSVTTANRKFHINALNEIILKGKNSKIIQMDVFIDKIHLQKFVGDGIIISTPIGSTAYNYSLGGSVVYPELKSLQILPIAPINSKAYRSLDSSIIVPGDMIVTLKPQPRYKNSSIAVIDGDEKFFKELYKIDFKISNKTIKRLVFKKDFYWNNLKDKFL